MVRAEVGFESRRRKGGKLEKIKLAKLGKQPKNKFDKNKCLECS